MPYSIDLLHFNPAYSVLICTRCSFALISTSIEAHLRSAHASDIPLADKRTAIETWEGRRDLSSASTVSKLHVSPQAAQIQYLALYDDGISCRLCPDEQPYICRTRFGMQSHLRAQHSWRSPQAKGRQSVTARLAPAAYANVVNSPIYCQTFYQQSQFVRFFQVASPGLSAAVDNKAREGAERATAVPEPSRQALDLVELQLDRKLQALHESTQAKGLAARPFSQVDP